MPRPGEAAVPVDKYAKNGGSSWVKKDSVIYWQNDMYMMKTMGKGKFKLPFIK